MHFELFANLEGDGSTQRRFRFFEGIRMGVLAVFLGNVFKRAKKCSPLEHGQFFCSRGGEGAWSVAGSAFRGLEEIAPAYNACFVIGGALSRKFCCH